MENILDRRTESRARVELALPVELGHGGFDESFEADAVDLSPGGLALRSPCLPEVGSRLSCRFESVPDGRLVSLAGEVVWAEVGGERGGEFGLRFIDVEPEDQALIDEMLAERAHRARSLGPCREGSLVKLQVEGAGGAIQARVAQTDDELTTFEQELDLLALGRAVLASQTYGHGRRGKIAHVDLRFDGATPLLAVTVSFAEGRTEYGEFRVTETAHEAAEPEPGDTAPDLEAPVRAAQCMDDAATEPSVAATVRSRFSQTTVTEFDAADAEPGAHPDTPLGSVAIASVAVEPASQARGAEPPASESAAAAPVVPGEADGLDADADELPAALWDDRSASPAQAPALASAARAPEQLDLLAARTGSARDRVPHALDDDDPIRHEFQPGLSPWLLRAAAVHARLLEWARFGANRTATLVASCRRVLGPRVLWLLVRARGSLAKFWRQELAPFFGALRRLVASKLAPRRRTTAAPRVAGKARAGAQGSAALRTASLVGMCVAAVGLGAYAVWPSSSADTVALHRPVQPPSAQPAVAAAPAGAAEAAAPVVPQPEAVPPSSPYAATPAERAAARAPAAPAQPVQPAVTAPASPQPAVSRGLSFGASDVPSPRRFVLRMSAPVKRIEGSADAGGFTVTIPGALSLDRAGPISATLASISRAMILNKGDRAELVIRFAPGKAPRYRVQAQGQAIEILIGS